MGNNLVQRIAPLRWARRGGDCNARSMAFASRRGRGLAPRAGEKPAAQAKTPSRLSAFPGHGSFVRTNRGPPLQVGRCENGPRDSTPARVVSDEWARRV